MKLKKFLIIQETVLQIIEQIKKTRYAFVQYFDNKNAEKAITEIDGMKLDGFRLKVQWSKKSGRFRENGSDRGQDKRWIKNNNKEKMKIRKRSPDYGEYEDYTYCFTESEESEISKSSLSDKKSLDNSLEQGEIKKENFKNLENQLSLFHVNPSIVA